MKINSLISSKKSIRKISKRFDIFLIGILIESKKLLTLIQVNPFVPNAPFLYLLKTSEKRKVFSFFQGVEKGCTGNKWVNN